MQLEKQWMLVKADPIDIFWTGELRPQICLSRH